ncbi:MAG TPA: ABC transporter permease [Bacteroidales bacterium]|nr:ABC transporter permease [Bacteroidales bacterium]NLP20130.1 ABC transporter permease [Bacteroidales bacterium]HOE38586.1 ABC transporter permease [Bacteroidales bacterium]HOR60686.1 ABC transporter permease [Bacteroidales bacterium]HPL04781.1 ABC transporter permease [Bacteroidales bacterium]
MNTELYLAKRIVSKKHAKHTFSRPIVAVAIGGIALGIAVMILSIAIVTGFKNEITNKVVGFGSHLQIVNFDNNTSYETYPISKSQTWLSELKQIEGVESVNMFITKAGIAKTDEDLQGVIFKGIDNDFDWKFFKQYLTEGDTLLISDSSRNNGVVVSASIANALKLNVGDSFSAYFIQEPPRMRKFTIIGIYETKLEDLDKIFVLCDIKHLRKLNDWKDDEITGFEVKIQDFSKIMDMEIKVSRLVGNYLSADGGMIKVKSIVEDYPGIFDWLSLLDINVWVILILMLSVAGFNMISGLLVIILERVNMIGILKSIGASNVKVAKVFIYVAGFLISRGMLIGNIIGIGLCLLQKYFGIITLDADSYYVSVVPINLDLIHLLLLNIGSLVITLIMMILPSMLVSKISPAETIRFN